MNLQKCIIKQYKEKYPSDKLKDISRKTSIQITRVFRILNGAEMKISEYELFNRAIKSEHNATELLILSELALQKLSRLRRNYFILELRKALKVESLKSNSQSSTVQTHIL